jgi:hypothetical protein
VSVPATDSDVPAQTLGYALLTAPSGANVNSSGLFTWTPSQAQAPSTNLIVLSVTDNGPPNLSATQSFSIVVNQGLVCTGLEGDVSGTNNSVSAQDWSVIGIFAAQLRTPTNECQFQHADCWGNDAQGQPLPCGDGCIDISDWTRAGLYAGQLTNIAPLVQVCGPTWFSCGNSPMGFAQSPGGDSGNGLAASPGRTLIVSNMTVAPGETNWLQIHLDAQGDENALQFSLSYETNLLTYVTNRIAETFVALRAVNTNNLSLGQIGFSCGLDSLEVLPPGLQVVVEVAFRATQTSEPISASVTVGDEPTRRKIVDYFGNTLPVEYQNGTVTITTGGGSVAFQAITLLGGGQVSLTLLGEPGSILDLEGSLDLSNWDLITTLTNVSGTVQYTDTVPAGSPQRFYRAVLR